MHGIHSIGLEKWTYMFSKYYCFLKSGNEKNVFLPPPTAVLIILSDVPDGEK